MLTRRMILMTGGAAAVIGGVSAGLIAQGPGTASAVEPWRRAGQGFGDPRLDALAYAILAPNPHNRQPWQFQLVGDDQIDVFCDLEKRLPHTDPFDRQITIGFGCMLGLLGMAAAQSGFEATVVPFPEGEPQPRLDTRPVARVMFRPAAESAPDPLFTAVLERRSNKTPFDTSRPVEAGVLDAVIGAAGTPNGVTIGGTIEPDRTQRLRTLAHDGFLIEYETALTRRESIDLMRIGNREVAGNPDGIDMGGIPMGLMKMAGLVNRQTLDQPGSTAYKSGLQMYDKLIKSAMGFVWLTAGENTRASQIEAGGVWIRMNLAAQQQGLGLHPLSQVLQEFDEMAGPFAAAQAELGVTAPGVVHMLGRVGYAPFPAPSPRWPLESKLLNLPA